MAASADETIELKLRLSKQVTQKLSERAAQSGRDVAGVASDLIEKAVAEPAVAADLAQRITAWESWVAGMRKWGREHFPPGHAVDDSRESIYEGRGE